MNQEPIFHNGAGLGFSGFSAESLNQMRETLLREFGLTNAQTVEAASYSLAMVARFALGLSAAEGRVCALVGDSLASCICLATLRHLINSGAEGIILFIGEKPANPSEDLALQLKPLERMGATFETWTPDNADIMRALFGSCHNVLCGLHGALPSEDPMFRTVVNLLNDIQTPIHAVDRPLGVEPDSGEKDPLPLFASSTLSLGAPLQGLFHGRDYVGRHYVCDVSFTREIYKAHGPDLSPIFSEQPVVQIYPLLPEDKNIDEEQA